jgi:hypothetical protein
MLKNKKSKGKGKAVDVITPIQKAKKIKLSVSVEDVMNHLDFLQNIDHRGDKFYDDHFVRNAIRRYEQFWIPFILEVSDDFDDDLKYAPPLGKFLSLTK